VGECPSGEALAQSQRRGAAAVRCPHLPTHKSYHPRPPTWCCSGHALSAFQPRRRRRCSCRRPCRCPAALSLPAVCCTAAALHHAARECPPPSTYPSAPPPSRACPLWVLPPVLGADYSPSTPNPTYVVAFVAPPKASKPASHPTRQQSFTSHLLRPPLLPISSRDVDQSALHHTALRSWFLSW
jgi:hypothetical protein